VKPTANLPSAVHARATPWRAIPPTAHPRYHRRGLIPSLGGALLGLSRAYTMRAPPWAASSAPLRTAVHSTRCSPRFDFCLGDRRPHPPTPVEARSPRLPHPSPPRCSTRPPADASNETSCAGAYEGRHPSKPQAAPTRAPASEALPAARPWPPEPPQPSSSRPQDGPKGRITSLRKHCPHAHRRAILIAQAARTGSPASRTAQQLSAEGRRKCGWGARSPCVERS